MRYRLLTLLIVLAIIQILAGVSIFAHRRYIARVEGLRKWQEISPNIRLVRPTWWIFESTIRYEEKVSQAELDRTAEPSGLAPLNDP